MLTTMNHYRIVPAHIGPPGYSATYPAIASSARKVREMVTRSLSVWGMHALSEAAELVASELVSNVVRHTTSTITEVMVQQRNRELVRLGVTDNSTVIPKLTRCPEPDDESGRGLLMIGLIAQEVGVDLLDGGKRVWADISLSDLGDSHPSIWGV